MNMQLVVSAVAIAGTTWTHAQTAPRPVSDAALEQAYWHCIAQDSRSTAAGVRMDESALVACSAISKELQMRRFGGDFGKLHAWTKARNGAMNARK